MLEACKGKKYVLTVHKSAISCHKNINNLEQQQNTEKKEEKP